MSLFHSHTTTTLTTLLGCVGFFLTPKKFSASSAGCPTIPFSLDTNGSLCRQVKSSVPQDCPFHLRCQFIIPGCHLYFWPTSYKSEVPMTPFSNSVICYNRSQNSGKHLPTFTGLLYNKGHDKGYRWTAEWENCTGAEQEPGVPCPLQACHSRSTSTCSLTWKLSEPCTFGIYESSHMSDRLLTPFLVFLPSTEWAAGLKTPSF